jgi:phosphohistidine phosphatase
MLELVLIRHANAGNYTEPDIERHLSEKGKMEASQSAQVLKYSHHLSGTWLCSSATRTVETGKILMAINPSLCKELVIEDHWYHDKGEKYLDKIYQQSDPVIYLIAHNPSISYVASYFTNEYIQMQTAEIIHLKWAYAENWIETTANSAEKIYQFCPQISLS